MDKAGPRNLSGTISLRRGVDLTSSPNLRFVPFSEGDKTGKPR